MTLGFVDRDVMSHTVVRTARRAWRRAGVRRRDSRVLTAELMSELAAATADANPVDVLGDEPASAALDWARARGVTDCRLRLLLLVVPALFAGALAAGAVLAALADAFQNNGQSFLERMSGAGVLATYAGAGVLACTAILLVTGQLLRAVGDSTAAATVRVLAVALPLGAVAAVATGVGVAAANDFATNPPVVVSVCAAVLFALTATMGVARWIAVRRSRTPRSNPTVTSLTL